MRPLQGVPTVLLESSRVPLARSRSPLFSWVAAQRTLGDAIAEYVRFFAASTNTFSWKLTTEGKVAELRVDAPSPTRAGQRHALSWHLADVAHSARLLVSGFAPRALYLPSALAGRARAEELFGAKVLDGGRGALVFEASLLEAPLQVSLAPAVAQVALKVLEGALAERASPRQVSQLAAGIIEASLGKADVSAARVARAIAMSARTLSRRLEVEGTTFKALLDEARRARAAALVHQGKASDVEVADALGMSTRSFYRAFHRWYGATPRAVRGGLK
ncbi:MAG: helix-turn-helix domain-containing protein [Myxococcota bacterium]